MSDSEGNHHGKHEIIIIKRHGGNHEGAHGGAWKIAYADFMTAMMAFFLIMWLVNAANEETKAAVASYFNPIKLTDSKPAKRGLQKPADDAEGEAAQEKSKEKSDEKAKDAAASDAKDKSAQAGEQTKYSEADYFENPYSVLAEIAKDSAEQANVSAKGEGGEQTSGPATGADGGENFRDPFDPDFWTQQVEVSSTTTIDPNAAPIDGAGLPDDGTSEVTTGKKSDATGDQAQGDRKPGDQPEGDLKSGDGLTEFDGMAEQDGETKLADKATKTGKTDKDKNGQSDKDKAGQSDKAKNGQSDKDKSGQSDKDKNGQSDKDKNGKADSAAEKQAKQEKAAEKMQAQLRAELGKTIGAMANGLTVTATEGGLLVSITDQVKSPMFDVGSSVPKRETILAMRKIAESLKDQQGKIVIRGHTDARPYKKGEYDNWRLSTARAQSAYFMLLQGGLDEKRIGEVSGFADRDLKIKDKPMDDQNRRIEILIKSDEG